MGKNIIQIKSVITINVNVSAKNILYVKKIILEVFLHAVGRIKKNKQVLLTTQLLRVMKL